MKRNLYCVVRITCYTKRFNVTHNCSCAYNPQSIAMAQNDAAKYIPYYESSISISLSVLHHFRYIYIFCHLLYLHYCPLLYLLYPLISSIQLMVHKIPWKFTNLQNDFHMNRNSGDQFSISSLRSQTCYRLSHYYSPILSRYVATIEMISFLKILLASHIIEHHCNSIKERYCLYKFYFRKFIWSNN